MANNTITTTKSEKIREDIAAQLCDLDVAGYLLDEVVSCLHEMNYFKLINLKDNIDAFKNYLTLLDQENTDQVITMMNDA